MAGLQTIIDNCNGLTIDRRNVVGIQYTRNEIPRVSLTPTFNPWRFTLEMPNSLQYSRNRDVLEALDTLDRYTPETITFDNNPCIAWIFAYQGELDNSQIGNITVSSFTGDQLVLTNLPSISGNITANTIVFKSNDLIQIGNNPFPFTSTTEVLRGSGSNITVTTSRPNILSGNVVNDNITVGSACEFYMFCPNMPTYKLIPGGSIKNGSTIVNNALIEFNDSFLLFEWVATA
jgi:hypothetical protein